MHAGRVACLGAGACTCSLQRPLWSEASLQAARCCWAAYKGGQAPQEGCTVINGRCRLSSIEFIIELLPGKHQPSNSFVLETKLVTHRLLSDDVDTPAHLLVALQLVQAAIHVHFAGYAAVGGLPRQRAQQAGLACARIRDVLQTTQRRSCSHLHGVQACPYRTTCMLHARHAHCPQLCN